MRNLPKFYYAATMLMALANAAHATEKNHFWNNAGLTYSESDRGQTYLLHGNYELGYRTYAYAGVGYGKIDDFSNSFYDFNFEPLYSVRVGVGHYYELASNVFVFGELTLYRDKGSYTRTSKPGAPALCFGIDSGCSFEIELDETVIFASLGSLWQITDQLDIGLKYTRVDGPDRDGSNRFIPSIRYRISDDFAIQLSHTTINNSSDSINGLSLLWTY
jgi:hypothetical protein